MRVRGTPSLDETGSGVRGDDLHHHHFHHHHRMMTRDDSAMNMNSKSSQFEEMVPFRAQSTSAPASTSVSTPPPPAWEQRLSSLLSRVAITMEKNEFRMSDQDKKDTIKLEWQQAALILDR
jgi:hypothetical protein